MPRRGAHRETMADNEVTNEDEPSGGMVSTLIVVAIVLALAGGAGFFLYRFAIAPRLAPDSGTAQAAEDVIPVMPVNVEFPQKFVNIMRQANEPASTLVFQVTLECNNPATANLINTHKIRFEDMIIKLHDSRTRDELDDVLALKTSIQRQAKQKANDLLLRLGASSDMQVTEVFHNLFMVQDQG